MKTHFLFALLICSLAASAQVKLGLKSGVGLPEIKVKEFDGQATYNAVEAGEPEMGFHAGAFLRVNIASLYVQPEAYYTKIRHTFSGEDSNGDKENLDINFDRFDIPLLAGLKFGPARINAGPVASINLGGNNRLDGGLKDATWGFQLGAGLDLADFTIDVRYEGPFSNTAEEITIGNNSYQTDMRTNQLLISLGYSFL